jgi:predicted GIY-YIG superfamily endonuclease
MVFIYILKLQNGKWYIGKTNNVFTRYAQHKEGRGSAWTRIHKPIKVHFSYEQKSPFDEDKTTKEYMAKYGIQNVRGGAFVKPTLPNNVVQELQREIWMATDCCFHCGSPDHFGKHCPTPTPTPTLESTEPQTIQNKQCETPPKQLSSHATPDSLHNKYYECAWCGIIWSFCF